MKQIILLFLLATNVYAEGVKERPAFIEKSDIKRPYDITGLVLESKQCIQQFWADIGNDNASYINHPKLVEIVIESLDTSNKVNCDHVVVEYFKETK